MVKKGKIFKKKKLKKNKAPLPNKPWQAHMNAAKDIGQDKVLKGGRELLLSWEFLPLAGVINLLHETSKNRLSILVVEVYSTGPGQVFKVNQAGEVQSPVEVLTQLDFDWLHGFF
jgi:hypothetical protein